jgi:hypothetical protein
MTQLVTLAALTRVMRGGRHRCIRSHCIAFDCTPGPPILLLPRSIEDIESYRVVMVGEFTPAQSEKVRKMHRVRNRNVREVFEFYKQNNHLYTNVIQNEPVLVSDDLDAAAQTFLDNVEDSSGELSDGINREQETVRGENDAFRVVNEDDEINVIEGYLTHLCLLWYKSTRWHPKLEIVASAGLKFVDQTKSQLTFLVICLRACFRISFRLAVATQGK